jgi:hypothetical protein
MSGLDLADPKWMDINSIEWISIELLKRLYFKKNFSASAVSMSPLETLMERSRVS